MTHEIQVAKVLEHITVSLDPDTGEPVAKIDWQEAVGGWIHPEKRPGDAWARPSGKVSYNEVTARTYRALAIEGHQEALRKADAWEATLEGASKDDRTGPALGEILDQGREARTRADHHRIRVEAWNVVLAAFKGAAKINAERH